nr:MAG TPA: protein of unknown function (DUF4969) [Caudoviricetes sp.]
MKSNVYYLFLALMALLLMSCEEAPRTEKDSVIEYDVIEIDSCEYIMVQSEAYRLKKVTSIAHKGNCKYCKERNNTEQINTSVEHKTVTDTILIYKYIK